MAIGTAYIKIMPEAKGISGEIAGVTDPAAESAGKSGGGKWSAAFKKMLAVAGIGAAVGKALFAGADLQQSIGGIETLYKDSADKMMAYANQAYKTAGVSANDYMQQATSFSAALISSYNGDVNAAADATNQAMIDMADNANKMGTPLESIQMAYQGFAKQNYTMLDNLKLGYGGTKTEMERLLADAEKITGVHYDINELGDVYDAIHVIQGELGITGTTAEEAASTISGSIGMMKASWQDFMGNLALGNDIYPQMEALAESVIAVIRNVVPAVWNIITGIPRMIIEHWPEILAAVQTTVNNLITYVQSNWPMWVQTVFSTIQQIGQGIITNLPVLIGKAQEVLAGIIGWLQANFPTLVQQALQLLGNLFQTLMSNLPTILAKLGQLVVTLVRGLVQTAWRTAQTIFLTIISGIGQFASNILQKLRSGLSTVWSVITSPFSKAKETLDGIVEKIKGFFPIHFGKIFDGLKLPHFNVKGGEFPYGVAGKGSLPSFSIDWYKKAETQPYMFTDATLFGAGERNDEILYGRNQLMKDIAQATSGGDAFTINVFGAPGMDVNELADAVERRIIEAQNRRRLAWQ